MNQRQTSESCLKNKGKKGKYEMRHLVKCVCMCLCSMWGMSGWMVALAPFRLTKYGPLRKTFARPRMTPAPSQLILKFQSKSSFHSHTGHDGGRMPVHFLARERFDWARCEREHRTLRLKLTSGCPLQPEPGFLYSVVRSCCHHLTKCNSWVEVTDFKYWSGCWW